MDLCDLDSSLVKKMTIWPINRKEIESFIKENVKNLGLNKFLKGIIFTNDVTYAAYNYEQQVIFINYRKLLNTTYDYIRGLNKTCDIKLNIKEKMLFINMFIIQSIIHEIAHINQRFNIYCMKNLVMSADDLLGNQKNILTRMNFEYEQIRNIGEKKYHDFHNYFMIERDANFTSYENSIFLLKRYFAKYEKIFEIFLNQIKGDILCYYDDGISPQYYLFKCLYESNDITPSPTKNIYETLKLGYPINQEKYHYFVDNIDNIIINETNKKILKKEKTLA